MFQNICFCIHIFLLIIVIFENMYFRR